MTPLRRYLFWLEIGVPVEGAIDLGDSSIDLGLLPDEGVLDVAVFPDEGLEFSKPQIGQLRVTADRTVVVHRRAARVAHARAVEQRLFFGLHTPGEPGPVGFRCHIYHRGVLLQSKRVEAVIGETAGRRSATTDYVLTNSLELSALRGISPHRLSLFVNMSSNGTHTFRFLGDGNWGPESVHFSRDDVTAMVEGVRAAFRQASWGSSEKWDGDVGSYRYSALGGPDFGRLEEDLKSLAKAGFRMWDQIRVRLGGGRTAANRLTELMRRPGSIQLAPKESPEVIPPIAGLYDYPLDTDSKCLTLCNSARLALCSDMADLSAQPCFAGMCPDYECVDVVCPGGFWGYRHNIGVPVSLPTNSGEVEEARTTISVAGGGIVGASIDPQLMLRVSHIQDVQSLLTVGGLRVNYTEDRDQLFRLFGHTPGIIYLYCHGGEESSSPYISIGPLTQSRIFRDTLTTYGVDWSDINPLVFLNGCHTTSVSPEQAINLVAGFIDHGAAGVIGTEITVFEPMATSFAIQFLQRFVVGRVALGESTRRARLYQLQRAYNPLGLVYIPFGLADLRVVSSPPE